MTRIHSNLQLPGPVLPEHLLIRDSAPVPQLSAGFRARVMSECTVSIMHARRIRRWKFAGTAAAVCALSLLIATVLPGTDSSSSHLVEPDAQQSAEPHGQNSSYPSSSLAADIPQPATNRKPEKTEGIEVIESLNRRQQQLFDAGMLPKFR
ncbi:MAG: hypothetical protein R3C59_10500 [Planctomycetaceae bacterium]